jgi:hypothetical protein
LPALPAYKSIIILRRIKNKTKLQYEEGIKKADIARMSERERNPTKKCFP